MTKSLLCRCSWADPNDKLYLAYHDTEWGVAVHDDRKHFEFLILEGAQAGLSWQTILKRREGYRNAFADFDPVKVATFTEKDVENLLQNPGIIRNRLKIRSVLSNAKHFLAIQKEFGSFDAYLWQFVSNKTIHNHWEIHVQVPAKTKEAETLSKDLKKRGFTFVGPTIMYAYMQAVGLVNDHLTSCFRHKQVLNLHAS
ncbi:MAG: DNA-3-methyladenine glycosylase I [Chlamydiales bacterium]|nr:DNA-3-methyladenine glycosylase I [Chlamydiales bacterium]